MTARSRGRSGSVHRYVADDIVVDGLKYAEGLRWHDDQLWFSDMLGDAVFRLEGDCLVQVFDAAEPSGIGFLSDGRIMVVCRGDTTVRVGRPGEPLRVHRGLGTDGVIGVNDLLVTNDDRGYVGSLGTHYRHGDEFRDWGGTAPGRLLLLEPDGTWHVAAEDLACPNGMVLTPDGQRLIAAETYRHRLTTYRRAVDGSLQDARTLVRLNDTDRPDGIALDARGGIWIATGSRCLHVDAAGTVDAEVVAPGFRIIACALGGIGRRTLFLAVCQMTMESFQRRESRGQIRALQVDVGGAGLP